MVSIRFSYLKLQTRKEMVMFLHYTSTIPQNVKILLLSRVFNESMFLIQRCFPNIKKRICIPTIRSRYIYVRIHFQCLEKNIKKK